MSEHTTGYTDDHAKAGLDVRFPAIETWRNQFRAYEILIDDPEFTSVCPKTGLPDFGVLTIRYMPKEKCLELKSLKEYLFTYRNLGIFQENIANQVLDDVVKATDPVWCEVKGDFRPRGGISTVVVARYPRSEAAPWGEKPRVEDSEKPRVEKVATPIDTKQVALRMSTAKSAVAPSATPTRTDGVDVIIHHRFLLPCETVYDAFVDADMARQFMFATPDGEMVVAEIEPRVGGSFTFVDRRDGIDVMHIGEYLQMQRPKRLVFSFIVPQYSSESTTVALDFVWKNTSVCDVMLRHSGVAKEHEDQTATGWKEMLKGADRALNAKG
jgi:7-cyano-7-deazaguanine reductase